MTLAASQARYDQQPEQRRRDERANLTSPSRCARGELIHRPATSSTRAAFVDVETIVQKLIHQGYALRNERESVMAVLAKLSDEGLLRRSSPERS